MLSFNSQGERKHGISWPRIAATLLVQILVLLALLVAVVRYLEWSSEANRAEFISATKPSASDPNHRPESSLPLQSVKGRTTCYKAQSTGP
jgi:hypothetical protein